MNFLSVVKNFEDDYIFSWFSKLLKKLKIALASRFSIRTILTSLVPDVYRKGPQESVEQFTYIIKNLLDKAYMEVYAEFVGKTMATLSVASIEAAIQLCKGIESKINSLAEKFSAVEINDIKKFTPLSCVPRTILTE
ncbi:hypothetical protein RF11_14840 [Thelohanellus kitauei]|uniref:Uncharacterized protein n=1 Tax=Thelohanellus kitauei TaxID=669202 RepID=A0A0C2JMC2_THEKT|nr:hypothetical protein RF11_14840 [Thelohanellus kitauei]